MTENNGMNNPQWEDPTPRAKPNGKGRIMGIAALGVAAVLGIGVYASGILGNLGGSTVSKPDQVSQALASLAEGEDNKFMNDWLGSTELTKNMMKGYNFSGNLELVDLPALTESFGMTLPKGIMLSFEGAQDSATKTGSGKLSAGMMGTNFLSLDYFASETKFQAAVPALFKEVITADLSGDLAAKIKAAPLFQNLEGTEDAQEAINVFVESFKTSQAQSDRMLKLLTGELKLDTEYKGLSDAAKTFKTKWVIEDAEKKTMTVNGKSEAFKGYRVTVKKADYIAFLKDLKTFSFTDAKFKTDFLDVFVNQYAVGEGITKDAAYTKLSTDMDAAIAKLEAEPMAKDLLFTVHMTPDNKLVALTSEYEGKDSAKLNLEMERTGGNFMNENARLKFTVTGGENPGAMEVVSTGKTEGNAQTRQIKITSAGTGSDDKADITIDSSVAKDTGLFTGKLSANASMEGTPVVMDLTVNGKYADIVKDKSGAFLFDEIRLTMNQKPMATFKAEYRYNTENVVVKPLEGTPMDLFTATEDDMNNLMMQIQENMGGLLNLLGVPLGF